MKLFGFEIAGVFFIATICSPLMADSVDSIAAQTTIVSLPFKTPALEYARVQAKCAEYQQMAERIQARRAIVFCAAGIASVAAGMYFIHQWQASKKTTAVAARAELLPAGINVDKEIIQLLAQRVLKESTFGGKCLLIFENTRDELAKVFLLSILLYPFNRLVGSIAEKASGLLWFDGKQKIASAEQTFLRDARFFYQSFLSLIKKPTADSVAAPVFVQRLADQVKRGVRADFTALCYTLEECFALLLACVGLADEMSDDDKQALEHDVLTTCDLFNQAAQEIAVVVCSDVGDFDDALTGSFAVHVQKLFGECERLIHTVGMHLFGD